MRTIIAFLTLALTFLSCGQNTQKRDNYESQPATLQLDSIIADTSKLLIVELPIYFDSTDFIIHPIGFKNLNDRNSKLVVSRYSGGGHSDIELHVRSYREDSYTGNITNLIFENLETRSQHLLTEQALNINSINYLRDIARVTKIQYLLYTGIDQDINHDGSLDRRDNNSLFVSKFDGTDFSKITKANEEYFDGELITRDIKYYFRTTEEKEIIGSKDKADIFHYYFIDFSKDPYLVIEYNPLSLIIK